ncbi:MAG: hypothetical protein SFX73_03265 [Kofleriaceae bacterium]|nr:hypothetical protein [Kofleriaceae bacterium]
MAHRWHFFRAGGVDQVSLRDGKDITALAELDKKLWVALAMPTSGVDIEPETLALIDHDSDGRLRVEDILEAVAWVKATFKRPDDILESSDAIELSALADEKVVASAKRMLEDLNKPDASKISVDDATAITKAFADTVLNGDGIVINASTNDADLKRVIDDIIATIGSVTDRSGKPGVDTATADAFFAAVDVRAAWLAKGADSALLTVGDQTAAAHAAFTAIRAKLEDYFTRCKVAAFDPRGATALGGRDDELAALALRTLSASDDALAKFPLAKIDPAARLILTTGINPAWADKLAAFISATLTPILGAGRDVLTPADLATITDKLAAYDAWKSAEPKTKVDGLDAAWITKLATPDLRTKLTELIAKDAALGGEYEQIKDVARAVRLQRDGGRLLRNFVNFSDFYSRQNGVFQAGTLYLDARALHLCVPVADAAKHSALASASDAYLVYCDISRKGTTKQIAAALTNGDSENIFVGRNGIFYDRDGNDWDATVTKIIANPIGIREAFWSPYKKLVKTIEDTVGKRAAAADADSAAKVTEMGTAIGSADKAAVPAGAAAPPPKKIDLGTVAAIGVAIGGVGTLVGALLGTMFGLGKWLPLGIIALVLLISGPAMLLAYLKLRRRNLGPILDANGWAINNRARINVSFGAAMTELGKLPKGSTRTLDDPFADKRTPWKRWVFLAVLIILLGTWYVGKLDRYIPRSISSAGVLGDAAPVVKAAKEKAAAEAAAPPAKP